MPSSRQTGTRSWARGRFNEAAAAQHARHTTTSSSRSSSRRQLSEQNHRVAFLSLVGEGGEGVKANALSPAAAVAAALDNKHQSAPGARLLEVAIHERPFLLHASDRAQPGPSASKSGVRVVFPVRGA